MGFPGYKTLGVRLAEVQTAAELTVDGVDKPTHPFGTRVSDNVGNEFVYVKAQGAFAVSKIITMQPGYDCTPLAGAGVAWAVALGTVADNGAGWVQVKGVVTAYAITDLDAGDQAARLTDGSGHLLQVDNDGTGDGEGSVFGVSLGTEASNLVSIYIY